jgi:hypothetical protein
MRSPLSPVVLDAIAVSSLPVALDGGRGSSWRAGDVALKPLDMPEDELAWQRPLGRIGCDGFGSLGRCAPVTVHWWSTAGPPRRR